MNHELIRPAASIAGLSEAEARRIAQKIPPCFDPQGPYAARTLAGTLTTLDFLDRRAFDVYVTKDARALIERSADPRLATTCFAGPVLVAHHPEAPVTLLYVVVPGGKVNFSGVLPPELPEGLEYLGRARNLKDLARFAKDERLHGELERISGVPSEEVDERPVRGDVEATQALGEAGTAAVKLWSWRRPWCCCPFRRTT